MIETTPEDIKTAQRFLKTLILHAVEEGLDPKMLATAFYITDVGSALSNPLKTQMVTTLTVKERFKYLIPFLRGRIEFNDMEVKFV